MRRIFTTFFVFISLSLVARGQLRVVSTSAGGGPNIGTAPSVDIFWPAGVAVDTQGNTYVCDTGLEEVLKIDRLGHVTVVAGTGYAGYSGDGQPATSAAIDVSGGYVGGTPPIALDRSGNLFISDTVNSVVRRVNLTTGIINTVTGNGSPGYSGDGGPATSASLTCPRGIALDASGNLYIADGDSVIRRVDAATGIITTVAGTGTAGYSGDGGPATGANLYHPRAVVVDRSGNLFIADASNYRVRRVEAATGIITTVAGNGTNTYSGDGGPATSAGIGVVSDLALDSLGNLFLGGGFGNACVRRVDAYTRMITTVAGNGRFAFGREPDPRASAEFYDPVGITVDHSGSLFIGDSASNRVQEVRLPPFVTLSPMNVTSLTQLVGTTSQPQVITLTNTGTAPLNIANITIGGAQAGEFAQTNSCPGRLESGVSCQIAVTFTPKRAGMPTATLTIIDNAPDSPRTIALTGTGAI
jgi:sugar lactone lactonase YvrE